MVSFEIFVKAMLPSLSELKVLPSFCFAFKIPDDVAVTNPQCLSQPSSRKENSARKSNGLGFSVNIPLLIFFDTRYLTFVLISYLMQPTLAANHE